MTVRLASIAAQHWRAVDGYAAAHGADDLRLLPLDRFCSYMWWWATRNAEKESDIRSFEAKLWRPPPGQRAVGPWSPEEETRAFAALKQGLGR